MQFGSNQPNFFLFLYATLSILETEHAFSLNEKVTTFKIKLLSFDVQSNMKTTRGTVNMYLANKPCNKTTTHGVLGIVKQLHITTVIFLYQGQLPSVYYKPTNENPRKLKIV